MKTAGVYDETRKACTLTAALDIEILISKVGYVDHMQNYVVGARTLAVEKEWIFEELLDDDGDIIP